MGMMAQMALKELGDKTKRGQLGRILKGKVAGGLGYGYIVSSLAERGQRAVVEHEADIVRLVFKEFADGKSPEAIAKDLNKEAIPGPGGRPWSNTTIRGQAARGTGLLNNEMYRGVLVWNRCSYVKDPHRGKKVARPNPPEKYEVAKVPHLQIVDDALWIRVKARQEMIRDGSPHSGRPLARLITGSTPRIALAFCSRVYCSVGAVAAGTPSSPKTVTAVQRADKKASAETHAP